MSAAMRSCLCHVAHPKAITMRKTLLAMGAASASMRIFQGRRPALTMRDTSMGEVIM